nr:MAG TPA: hypothetical protein [Caudoviricetes sp.]
MITLPLLIYYVNNKIFTTFYITFILNIQNIIVLLY